MDYVGNYREGLVEPYHDFKGQLPKTGSLYDYLGLPTTIAGAYGNTVSVSATPLNVAYLFNCARWINNGITDSETSQTLAEKLFNIWDTDNDGFKAWFAENVSTISPSQTLKMNQSFGMPLYAGNCVDLNVAGWKQSSANWISGVDTTFIALAFAVVGGASLDTSSQVLCLYYDETDNLVGVEYTSATAYKTSPYNGYYKIVMKIYEEMNVSRVRLVFFSSDKNNPYKGLGINVSGSGSQAQSELWFSKTEYYSEQTGVRDIVTSQSPYYASDSAYSDKQLKISAYAARAYEAVYNCYFRDNRNRPYYVDGQVEYNKWIPSRAGGADNYKYQLHMCNWEKDAFTTAVQSPQQGIAPLVGITTYDEHSVSAEGTTTTVKKVALVDEDGRRFGVEFDSNSDGLLDVRYTELSNDTPVHKSRSLIELAQSGISIADFRNVNAYQKFLELNMRQGYSYRDIIQGRFEVKVRFDELMMPEYLGGFSEIVDMNAVTQTVQRADTGSYVDQLGAMAGNAGGLS